MKMFLQLLPAIMFELLSDGTFWKYICRCADKHENNFIIGTKSGTFHVFMSQENAIEWQRQLGKSVHVKKVEKWQAWMRDYIILLLKETYIIREDKVLLAMVSGRFGDLKVSLIPILHQENAFEIVLDAQEASCDAGGDGYGND